MKATIELLLLCTLFVFANAASYYVDGTNGNTNNAGTSVSAAFKTVQQCATKAVAGDTCYIRAGTYRETVTVKASGTASAGITFTAYNNEEVIISGLDVLSSKSSTGWSQHTSNIWKTNLMTWDLTDYSWAAPQRQMFDNQIFVDGQMMVPARWPNIPISDVTTATFDQFASVDSVTYNDTSHAVITDAAISSFSSDFWKGAWVVFSVGMMYQHGTCTVTGNSGSVWNMACNPIGQMKGSNWASTWNEPPRAKNRYYFWGKLAALDAPGEWWFDSATKTLYMYFPSGKSPANSVVEVKKRLDCLIVDSRNYVTVSGINTKGGRVSTRDASYITLSQMDIGYQWAQIMVMNFGINNWIPTIYFNGQFNTIKDCYIHDSAAAAVHMLGSGHKFINNVWARNNYAPQHQAVIFGDTGNTPSTLHLYTQNTLYETTDQGVFLVPGMEVSYNELYHTGRQRTDFGPVYCVATIAKGATVHHNWMHSCYSYTAGFGGCHGLYLDCGCQGYKMYRNVMWDLSGCGIIGMGQRAGTDQNADNVYAYNTVANLGAVQGGTAYPGGLCLFADQKMTNILVQNNIFPKKNVYTDYHPEAKSYIDITLKNNYIGDKAGLVNWPNQDFNLTSTSPAKGVGALMGSVYDYPGLPNGVVPDLGAYQSGLPTWDTPGALIRNVDIDKLTISCPSSATKWTTITCSISIPVFGRKLAPSFGIGLGASPAAGQCVAKYSYDDNLGSGSCTLSVSSALTGTQNIYVRLTSTSSWVATSITVTVSSTAVPTSTPTPAPTAKPTPAPTTTVIPTDAPSTIAPSTAAPTTKPGVTAAPTAPSSNEPIGFVNKPGASITQISVGRTDVIVGVTTIGTVARWAGTTTWTNNGGNNLTSVDIGCDGAVFAVGPAGQVYKFGSGGWTTYGTTPMKQVAVGTGAIIYGISTSGNLMKLTNTAVWTQWGKYSNIQSLSVGCDGSVWAVNTSNVGMMYSGNGTFQMSLLPGVLGQIAAGDVRNAWALSPSGDVYVWQSGTWVPKGIPGKLTSIGVSPDGLDVWGTTFDNKVWRYQESLKPLPVSSSSEEADDSSSTTTTTTGDAATTTGDANTTAGDATTTGDVFATGDAATTGGNSGTTDGDAATTAAASTTTTGTSSTVAPTVAPTPSSKPTTPADDISSVSNASKIMFSLALLLLVTIFYL